MGKADKKNEAPQADEATLVKAVAEAHHQSLALFPPPIAFYVKEKMDGAKAKKRNEKDDFKEIELKIDPTEQEGETLKKRVRIFETGTPEEWIRWRIEFDEVARDAPLTNASAKTKTALAFLRGKAREAFQIANGKRNADNGKVPPAEQYSSDEIFALVLEDVGKEFFPSDHAYLRQVNYMRHHLHMVNTTLHEFVDRLLVLNSFLPYFPEDPEIGAPRALLDWELRDILDRAKPVAWHIAMLSANFAMLSANFDMYKMSWFDTIQYFERLEIKSHLEEAQKAEKAKTSGPKNPYAGGKPQGSSKKNTQGKKVPCSICKKIGHTADVCWFREGGEGKPNKGGPPHKKQKSGGAAAQVTYTQQQVNAMLAALPMFQQAPKSVPKRQVRFQEEEDDDGPDPGAAMYFADKLAPKGGNKSSSKDTSYMYPKTIRFSYMAKPSDGVVRLPEVLVAIVGPDRVENRPIRGLLDTGTSGTLVLRDFVREEQILPVQSLQFTVGYNGWYVYHEETRHYRIPITGIKPK